jgi:L-amino acid N-acyltransferase YncA/signal peptidase I
VKEFFTLSELSSLLEEVTKTKGGFCIRAFGTSMVPIISPGDLLYITPVSVDSIRVGHILAIKIDSKIIIHRLIKLIKEDQRTTLILKGDFLSFPDPPQDIKTLLGRVTKIDKGWIVLDLEKRYHQVWSFFFAKFSQRFNFPPPWIRSLLLKSISGGEYLLTSWPLRRLKRLFPLSCSFGYLAPHELDSLLSFYLKIGKNVTKESLESLKERFFKKGGSSFLVGAKVKGNLIGIAGITPFGKSQEEFLFSHLYIRKRFRGYGIGRILLSLCLSQAKRQGAKKIWSSMEPKNFRSIQLHKSLGFCPEPTPPVKKNERHLLWMSIESRKIPTLKELNLPFCSSFLQKFKEILDFEEEREG